ncbi:DUF1989 domain-containing protein [Candidatus Methanocrinis natronophilus]|uniref:DUF1989 domain-containing protein n=1 Tax=Candidatus Methanocrinis natronophilus TaxID=3033396 RepID=A0ABT5X8H5_9EURY|nr:DUF1989 domain-containing protein [Candidatus Methanocrinis natronophilus]MDF0590980.1 DUF1989 domain-containing protein [Candidatus Methanocrinis natronophilus]
MEFTLRKGEAKGFVISRGQTIKISCKSGGQLSDLVFLNYHQGITLDRIRRFILKVDDELFDVNEEAVLKVTSIDSESNTNILYPGCRRRLYKEHFSKEKDGCRDLLASALGINTSGLPSTVNLFMDFKLNCSDYSFKTEISRAKDGDSVSFKALKNCTIAVSACPCEADSCRSEGDILVEIYDD